jgi:hypothetical protein
MWLSADPDWMKLEDEGSLLHCDAVLARYVMARMVYDSGMITRVNDQRDLWIGASLPLWLDATDYFGTGARDPQLTDLAVRDAWLIGLPLAHGVLDLNHVLLELPGTISDHASSSISMILASAAGSRGKQTGLGCASTMLSHRSRYAAEVGITAWMTWSAPWFSRCISAMGPASPLSTLPSSTLMTSELDDAAPAILCVRSGGCSDCHCRSIMRLRRWRLLDGLGALPDSDRSMIRDPSVWIV